MRRTLRYADGALAAVEGRDEPWLDDWRTQVAHYRDLAGAVVRQTVRRVLKGETVPAEEKVVSLFEPHTDIIRKGGRRVQYGHKVNLGSGASGLVFDAVVEAGNPADSARCLPMIERYAAIYGSVPEQVACDGGYASKANLAKAKALGVHDMVFHKKKGLKTTDMASSPRGLRAAEELPGRHGGRGLVPQALLRPRPLQLARAGTLPGLRLVGRRHAQSLGDRASQVEVETGLNRQRAASAAPADPGSAEPAGLASPESGEKATLTAATPENPYSSAHLRPQPPSRPNKHRSLRGVECLRRQKMDKN